MYFVQRRGLDNTTQQQLNDKRMRLEAIIEAPDGASTHMSSISGSRMDEDGGGWAPPPAPTLCGRSRETLKLLKVYQQVVHTKSSKIVFVHAESGMGKTALVESLRQPVCRHGGYFCSGKFFQDTVVQEPYAAVMAAFSDLCELVSQTKDFDARRRSEIREKLGSTVQVLSKVITSLSLLVREDEEEHSPLEGIVDIKNESLFAVFKLACTTFLRVMSSVVGRPIVLFLDDIQWMDPGSKELLGMMLRDCELQNVLFVLAFRDEEATKVAQFVQSAGNDACAVEIHVSKLDSSAVHQMVSAYVGSNCEQTKALSQLVFEKSFGNPFHVIQFIEAIQREELLVFDYDNGSFQFDVENIRREMAISDDLAHLLSLKVALLSLDVKENLVIAALVGFRFEESILLEVASVADQQRNAESPRHPLFDLKDSGTSISTLETSAMSLQEGSVHSSLTSALQLGFIESTRDGFAFCHDKVQSFFKSIIDQEEKGRLHRRIGEAYLSHGDPESLYHAAGHLNRAPSFIQSTEMQVRLARLNLEAADFCKEKSGFIGAAVFLRRGLELLD